MQKFSFFFLCFFSVTLQLEKFKEDNLHLGFGSATLALEQAIENTKANIKWVTENKAHVLKWFTEETAWERFKCQNETLVFCTIRDVLWMTITIIIRNNKRPTLLLCNSCAKATNVITGQSKINDFNSGSHMSLCISGVAVNTRVELLPLVCDFHRPKKVL